MDENVFYESDDNVVKHTYRRCIYAVHAPYTSHALVYGHTHIYIYITRRGLKYGE